MKVLFCLLALLTGAIAAPLSPDDTSKTFKLKSLVLSPSNSSFNNLYLEPYHIFPGANYAVLSPKTATNPGIIGYLNGTAADFADRNTDLLFNANPSPYGFVIDSVNATYNPILINAGNGTTGIFIDQGIIKYHSPMSGGFYACNNTLEFGPAVQLFYKPKVIDTPTGCSDVELVVASAQ
ncbi:hypothetical protein IMSHALPRED_007193 [Imshaugia aleurites]|uniref:DUF7907 domain-containing protein n=1 Tax=Imshaugia aleurites TaxID=172621 RepID=A0A8H3IQ60_9LECA|nr:hypothetical protein IMSHALPRED_007193 [Imshaugia aleurites]